MLVPRVGIGMGAYGYLKSAGGVTPQMTALTQLGLTASAAYIRVSLPAAAQSRIAGQ